jgi:AAA+ ATPase superfamily predicted ATPase
MKRKNPFVIYGYEGPETFCDREIELEKLKKALENGRNVTLLSERRIGKTGLIKHLFNSLKSESTIKCIYVDIFATRNLSEFTAKFAEAIIGSMDSRFDKALASAARFFKSFRPEFTIDPISGSPVFSLGIHPQLAEASLRECFAYLREHSEAVIAIDEFQQIANYPEKGIEAILRSHVQFLPNVRFIFAGSRHHMMTEMFCSAKRPFYNSTQTLPLDRIDAKKYYDFAVNLMAKASIEFPKEVFDFIYSLFDGVTWYMQAVLNRLYERRSATDADVRSIVEELILEKKWEFAALLNALPEGSVRLLKAVAKDGVVREIMSGDFMAKYSLRSSSSVHLSLKKLIDEEIIYRTDDGYIVYDRLLGFWLRRS